MLTDCLGDRNDFFFDAFQRRFGEGEELLANSRAERFFVAAPLGTVVVIFLICTLSVCCDRVRQVDWFQWGENTSVSSLAVVVASTTAARALIVVCHVCNAGMEVWGIEGW